MKAPTTHQHNGVSYEVHPPDVDEIDQLWMGFVWSGGHVIRVEFAPTREQVEWQCKAWINWTKAA